MKRVAIAGGGISGLAAAYYLGKLSREKGRPLEVVLYEPGRLGGTIETERAGGFVLEKGPDAFITDKPWGLELSRELGLEDRLIGTDARYRRSFVARKSRLIAVPEGFYLTAPVKPLPFLRSSIVSWAGKARMMAEPFVPAKKDDADESLGSFVRRRFGREALERVAQPMMAGIYTGDPDKLSLRATLPRFSDLERRHGSVTRGLIAAGTRKSAASGPRYGLFASFRDGMQTLTDALASRLEAGAVRTSAVRSASPAPGGWRVDAEDGTSETFDAVCLTVPATRAAGALSFDPALSGLLSQIEYESVLTVNLAYDASQVAHPLDGFGFVVPRTEGRTVIACSFSSRKFEGRAPAGQVLLRAFVGGAFGRENFERSDDDVLGRVEKELSEWLSISGRPRLSRVRRYSKAMVQYSVGHLDRAARIRGLAAGHRGLYLCGAAYEGPGIPDCVRHAEAAARQILETLEENR